MLDPARESSAVCVAEDAKYEYLLCGRVGVWLTSSCTMSCVYLLYMYIWIVHKGV